jgi:hypothetical protein
LLASAVAPAAEARAWVGIGSWRTLPRGGGCLGQARAGLAVGLRCPAVHAKYALSRARWPGRATGLNGHQVVAVEAGGLGTQTRGPAAAGLYCSEN